MKYNKLNKLSAGCYANFVGAQREYFIRSKQARFISHHHIFTSWTTSSFLPCYHRRVQKKTKKFEKY